MDAAWVPLILAAAAVAMVAIVAAAALAAWRGWLELKRLEIEDRSRGGDADPAALIEIASVKERLRRLEAIASGVEL